ncbi:MAG: tetratricopeptide repeat protein, partial [Nitrospinota bacterium]
MEGEGPGASLPARQVERMHLRILTLPDHEAAVIAQAEIERGLPFHIAVRDRSIGPNPLRGGYVGGVKLASLLPEVRAAVAGLREGEMSPIVKTPEGYSIFMRTTDRHFRAALERMRKGRYAEALPFLEEELKLNGDNIGAWLALGTVHSAFGRLAEAEAAYRRALEFDPEEATIYNNLGNVYVRQEKYDLAIEMYEKALQREPYLAVVLGNLAYLLAATGRDLSAAEGYIEEAIRLEPKEASHYDVRAQV